MGFRQIFLIVALVLMVAGPLTAQQKQKDHPIWNKKKCREVTFEQLKQGNIRVNPTEKVYIIGKFLETDGNTLKLLDPSVIFLLASAEAKELALNMDPKNVVVYGTIKLSRTGGRHYFNVFYLETAPTLLQIYEVKLSKMNTESFSAWQGLGQWSLVAGFREKNTDLLNKSKQCFLKSYDLWKKSLDPNNANHVPRYIQMIQYYRKINGVYSQMNLNNLKLDDKKLHDIIAILLKHDTRGKVFTKILEDMEYVKYKGEYYHKPVYKDKEGLLQYKGPVEKYDGRWVTPRTLQLLKAVEKRLNQDLELRDKGTPYYKALIEDPSRRIFAKGMNREEVAELSGFPQQVIRLRLAKTKIQNADFEIWVYGSRIDQYICFEDGKVFYFPDTFAPTK